MAFHPHPRLIQKLFNAYWFGPPEGVTPPSAWPRVDHLVSRLLLPTKRPLQTRFRFGSAAPCRLTSPGKATRRFIMQKARRHAQKGAPTACRHMVSGTISLPCSGCFSPFPHGTGTLSVSREYLALPDGPGRFTQDSSCPALLRIPLRFAWLRVRSFHALRPRFPARSARHATCDNVVLLPRACRDTHGLGSSPFARHYWGNHVCFLFLRVLRCFSSPRWPPALRRDGAPSARRVVPFGDPRINGHLRLPAAFRSLSRPSSPPRAKASAMCPYLLFPFFQRRGGIIPPPAPCATCHRTLPRTNAESGE